MDEQQAVPNAILPPSIASPVPSTSVQTPGLRKHIYIFVAALALFLTVGSYTLYVRNGGQLSQGPVAYSYTVDIDSIEDDTTIEEEPVEGFPQVPSYPDAELKDSARHLHGNILEYHTRWRSETEIETIYAWYRSELTNQGWVVGESDANPEQIKLTGTKEYFTLKLQVNTADSAAAFLYSDPNQDVRDAESEDEGDDTLDDNLITMSISYEIK